MSEHSELSGLGEQRGLEMRESGGEEEDGQTEKEISKGTLE